ncbi:MAG: GNAT family N-acetyltransferase [Candidatus Thorarchaeota archaeon]
MEEQTTRLRNGREVVLRLLRPDDRDSLLSMMSALSNDALRWSNPPYDSAKIDRWMSGAESGLSIVAICEEQLVGISAIYEFTRPREKGIGGMMIYIHQDFHGVGLGTVMTENLLVLAKKKKLHRVGLEVVEDNKSAVALYTKLGFKIEGVLHDAYFGEDGRYHNLLVMGILFQDK